MKLFIPVLICAACATSLAPQFHAQTPSQMAGQSTDAPSDPAKIAQIRRLLEIMGVQARMPQMMRSMTEQMMTLTESMSKSDDSSKMQQLEQFTAFLRERMIAKMQALDLVGLYVPVYDKHYSADDITALIAFYESPVGKKTLQLQNQITAESMQTIMPIVEKLIKESEAEVTKEHPELGMPSDSHPAMGGAIGGVQNAAPPPPPPAGHVTRITKGGEVAAATAMNKVAPVYPELARQVRVQGTVRLHIVIETDGRVIEVKYISGPAMLVQSAIDAVKQWQFKPTTLNGVPVQVECVLEINFNLRN